MQAHIKEGVLKDVTKMRPAWIVVFAHTEQRFGDLTLEDWLGRVRKYCCGWLEGTRVRSVLRKEGGIFVPLTQPAIIDPERMGRGSPFSARTPNART